ncbi:hypothetical protein BDZ97DRAFT_922863 [Flammula alnicola]|nr:hypothetical protein BDZ97DRAFT_922863 [Flammula alnicola]
MKPTSRYILLHAPIALLYVPRIFLYVLADRTCRLRMQTKIPNHRQCLHMTYAVHAFCIPSFFLVSRRTWHHWSRRCWELVRVLGGCLVNLHSFPDLIAAVSVLLFFVLFIPFTFVSFRCFCSVGYLLIT